jgi:hypothetical protein
MRIARSDPHEAAFYAFLDRLRDESFYMWETVRRVERGDRDGLAMCERMQMLGQVGRTAGRVAAEIEMLYAAVAFGREQESPFALVEKMPEPALR